MNNQGAPAVSQSPTLINAAGGVGQAGCCSRWEGPGPPGRAPRCLGKDLCKQGPGRDLHAPAPRPLGWGQEAWRSPCVPRWARPQVCGGRMASEGHGLPAWSWRRGPAAGRSAAGSAPSSEGGGGGGGRLQAGQVGGAGCREGAPPGPTAPHRWSTLRGALTSARCLRRRPGGGISSAATAAAWVLPVQPAPPARPRGGMRRRGAQDAPQPRDAPQTRQVHPGGHGGRTAGRLQHPVLRVHVSRPRRWGQKGQGCAQRWTRPGGTRAGVGLAGWAGWGHQGRGQCETPLWAKDDATSVPFLGCQGQVRPGCEDTGDGHPVSIPGRPWVRGAGPGKGVRAGAAQGVAAALPSPRGEGGCPEPPALLARSQGRLSSALPAVRPQARAKFPRRCGLARLPRACPMATADADLAVPSAFS